MTSNCTLTGLYVYPVKGFKGISLSKTDATERGINFDRRWMVIDEKGKFVTQRTENGFARIQVKLHNDHIELIDELERQASIKVSHEVAFAAKADAKVWDDKVTIMQVSKLADNWISELFSKNYRLVYQPDIDHRIADIKYAPEGHKVSLADGFPYLLCNEASLDQLNEKAGTNLNMNRFRPNLVIKGLKAFEEDNIRKIQTGDVVFRLVKPCARCVVTTIDQETGEKGTEPLKTLSAFRKNGNKILFGMNMIVEKQGELSVGSEVKIIE